MHLGENGWRLETARAGLRVRLPSWPQTESACPPALRSCMPVGPVCLTRGTSGQRQWRLVRARVAWVAGGTHGGHRCLLALGPLLLATALARIARKVSNKTVAQLPLATVGAKPVAQLPLATVGGKGVKISCGT